MAGRSWRTGVVRSAAVPFLCWALCACSNDLNALYARSGTDAGGRGEIPPLPALPDTKKRADCETCAKNECAMQRASCLEDDGCTAMLACKGKCSDPACLEACDVANAFSIWYRDYQSCVLAPAEHGGQCSGECGVGENWGCLGQYAFRATSNKRYEVEINFVGNAGPDEPSRIALFPPLAGATVRACGGATLAACGVTDNAHVLADATIGAYNSATLELVGLYDAPLQITGGGDRELTAIYD
ncbi:MAG: hypothetical protein ACHQ53_08185, partial [Polyangiales bacterium]